MQDIIKIQRAIEKMQLTTPAPGDIHSASDLGVHWYRKGLHDALRFTWALCEIAINEEAKDREDV